MGDLIQALGGALVFLGAYFAFSAVLRSAQRLANRKGWRHDEE